MLDAKGLIFLSTQNTRTDSQRQEDLVTLSDLLCQGVSIANIAKEIGVSTSQIHYDKKELEKKWQEEQLDNIDEYKKKLLRELTLVKKEAWSEINRSKEKHTKETLKLGKNINGEFSEESLTEEKSLADPRYLSIVVSCIKEESEILGIKKVDTNLNLTNNQVNINVNMPQEVAELIRQNENILGNYASD